MDLTQLQAAASHEHSAEQNRTQAEAAWRKAWWRTTIELAMVDKTEVGAAYRLAASILGQGERWMTTRRATGAYLMDNLTVNQLETLPPRLTVEYVKGKADPARAYDVLTQAEAEGTSIRELARSLGTQPKSWLREDEQESRPVTAEQVIKAVDELAESPEVRRAMLGAINAYHERKNLNRPHGTPDGGDEPLVVSELDARTEIMEHFAAIRDELARIADVLAKPGAAARCREQVGRYLSSTRNALDLIESLVSGTTVSADDLWAAFEQADGGAA